MIEEKEEQKDEKVAVGYSGFQSNPKIDWDNLSKKAGVIAVVFTFLGSLWVIHQELMEIAFRQGQAEGKIEIIMEDRSKIFENYKNIKLVID